MRIERLVQMALLAGALWPLAALADDLQIEGSFDGTEAIDLGVELGSRFIEDVQITGAVDWTVTDRSWILGNAGGIVFPVDGLSLYVSSHAEGVFLAGKIQHEDGGAGNAVGAIAQVFSGPLPASIAFDFVFSVSYGEVEPHGFGDVTVTLQVNGDASVVQTKRVLASARRPSPYGLYAGARFMDEGIFDEYFVGSMAFRISSPAAIFCDGFESGLSAWIVCPGAGQEICEVA